MPISGIYTSQGLIKINIWVFVIYITTESIVLYENVMWLKYFDNLMVLWNLIK